MSVQAMTWALKVPDLTTAERLLLILLADECDQDGLGHGELPNAERLQRLMAADPEPVLRALEARELIALDGSNITLRPKR